MYLSNRIRALVFVTIVFARGVEFDHNAIALVIDVWDTCLVFPFIVLWDKSLLAILNALPVSNEVDVE